MEASIRSFDQNMIHTALLGRSSRRSNSIGVPKLEIDFGREIAVVNLTHADHTDVELLNHGTMVYLRGGQVVGIEFTQIGDGIVLPGDNIIHRRMRRRLDRALRRFGLEVRTGTG